MKQKHARHLGLCLLLVPLAGCSSDEDEAAGGAGGTSGSAGAGAGGTSGSGGAPTLPDLQPGWNEFNPGGDTICSRGTPYAYWVHPGTVNRVVVDFIGGGACWDAVTCSVADAIFSDSVDQVRGVVEAGIPIGIYDKTRDDNPFKDWYHIVIPYCTGDVHWGDAVTTYGEGDNQITINHKGAVNSRAVLDWMYTEFSKPERVVVTGCSAGSYGSLGWAPHIMEHYQGTPVIQFGDSGAGVITDDFFRNSFPSWNATESLPDWIDSLNPDKVDIFSLDLADLYIRNAEFYPNNRFSQYNTTFDDNQTFYYEAMGGENGAEGWSTEMRASLAKIRAGATNFNYYRATGEQHCIIIANNFYDVETNGVKLTDWVKDLIEGESVVDVECSDCTQPTPGSN